MSRKIYLGNLSWTVASDDLARMLQDLGYDFTSATVVLDRETGRSRGFAFVAFRTPEAASEAIVNLDGHVIGGRPIRANQATERGAPGRGGERGKDPRSGGAGRVPRFYSGEADGVDWFSR